MPQKNQGLRERNKVNDSAKRLAANHRPPTIILVIIVVIIGEEGANNLKSSENISKYVPFSELYRRMIASWIVSFSGVDSTAKPNQINSTIKPDHHLRYTLSVYFGITFTMVHKLLSFV